MMTSPAIRGSAAGILGAGMLFTALSCTSTGNVMNDGSGSDVYLPTFPSLVYDSSAIVIANFKSIAEAGAVTLPQQHSSGPPTENITMLATTLTVESILKSDGEVTTTVPISYTIAGELPQGIAEVAADSEALWPHVWPVGTEFVLFLAKREGESWYYLPYYECGRILTSGSEVTCSDGNRRVLDFMSGVDRNSFIRAVQTEIAHPSGTETP